ncbi:MAG: VCBS repeat-containing protein [Planctomycetota bacterium]
MKLAPLLLGVVGSAVASGQSFEDHPLSRFPETCFFIDSADFDGDGLGDIVVFSRDVSTFFDPDLYVFLRRPDGSHAAAIKVGAGLGFVRVLAAVDLDVDGTPDLVASGNNIEDLVWFRGRGDGTFDGGVVVATLPTAPAFAGTGWLRVVDADADGDLDIYAGRAPNIGGLSNTYLLEGLGGTSFSAPVDVLSAAAADAFDVLAADVDGDGDLDVVAGAEDVDFVSVLENLGGGSFAAPVVLPELLGGLRHVVVDDFNADGRDDFVVGDNSSRVTAFTSVGGLLFDAETPTDDLPNIRALAAADLDGDVRPDLLVTGEKRQVQEYGWTGTYRNTSLFGANISFDAPVDVRETVDAPTRVRTDDLDGDGIPDVVIANLTAPVLRYFSSASVPSFDEAIPIPSSMASGDDVSSGDLDDDGDADVVCLDGGGTGALYWYENDASGTSWTERTIATSTMTGPQDRTVVVDFDGDADLDVLWTASEGGAIRVLWAESAGAGLFAPPVQLANQAAQHRTSAFEVVDLDRDGRLDLVLVTETAGAALVRWMRQNPNGTFMDLVTIHQMPLSPTSPGYGGIEIADMDADGDLDIVGGGQFRATPTSSVDRYDAHVLRQEAGSFAYVQLDSSVFVRGGEPALLDVDADGDLDVAVAIDNSSPLPGDIAFYRNDGVGAFGAAEYLVPMNRGRLLLAAADLDGDGDEDLVGGGGFRPHMAWFENDVLDPIGTPYCAPAVPNSAGVPAVAQIVGSAAVADNRAVLRATSLPRQAFGYFLTSRSQGFQPNVPNSVGVLCVGGSIGRFVGAGQVQNSGNDGMFTLPIDVTALPTPTGPVAALVGETWNFQAWSRDVVQGAATSNFTSGVSVTWQ